MTATATKSFKEFFSLASVERLSASFGDTPWLKERRLRGWKAFEQGLAEKDRKTGTRWLKGAAQWPEQPMEPGPKLAIPEALKPRLDGEWGPLAGAMSFGCEGTEPVLLDEEARKAGVLFLPLGEALRLRPDLIEKHLFSRTAVDETLYAALHAAYFGQGALVYIPRNVKLEKPLRLRGAHTGGHAGFFPHTLVIAEAGSEATVVDEAHSAGEAPGLLAGVAELILQPNARLNYINFQALNHASGAALRQSTVLADDARLYTLGVVAGGAWSTSFLGTRIEGGGGSVDLLGLALASGGQQVEIRTLQDHVGRSGNSDALVKSILRGSSRFYFDGVVKIFKSGQNTNAFQSNPNLLLSSDARAESIPTLEIEADDVACKHAASIGGIDEDEKFYLLSRGIPIRETETMITEGFAAELAQRLPDERLQERFVAILNRLASQASASLA
ncbi:MAG TPA: SufD family Fe-S cluster assembly protein [bacterium]|jgi:Fe-S cluster assembly protein SufD|nr:SufD family Fe-S cluster assembly protein [bacterium]